MLNELHGARHARQGAVPVSTFPNFTEDGLVLGAGTVLLRTERPRQLEMLAGQEVRVLALLSIAYGRAVAPAVLANIERASKAWREGDDCLAYVHLAHACLGELELLWRAAERLAFADAFLKAGNNPRTLFEAMKLGRSYIDKLEKEYNPGEPRVPAGSGRASGQWTRDGGGSTSEPLSYLTPGAASWLGDLAPSAATSLGDYALGLLSGTAGAAAAFGLILIPPIGVLVLKAMCRACLDCAILGIQTKEGSISPTITLTVTIWSFSRHSTKTTYSVTARVDP